MSFSFGGSGFGPSGAGSGLTFGRTGPPGTMQSGLSVDQVESATGSIAGIVGSVRSVWDNIKGNTPTGTGTVGYEGDPNYTPPVSGAQVATGSLKNVLSNMLDTLKRTGEAAVRGALEGAETTSAGARTGARVGAQASGLSTTALLGAGLLLVLVLRK